MLFRLRSRHKLFSNCDYTLVFSFSLVRGGSAEVVLLEINHLSGLKAWLVSLSIIVENLETFENGLRSHRRSSYPTNLEGIIKRNNKAINYSLLPPSKISLLLTPCFTVHHFKIRAREDLFWFFEKRFFFLHAVFDRGLELSPRLCVIMRAWTSPWRKRRWRWVSFAQRTWSRAYDKRDTRRWKSVHACSRIGETVRVRLGGSRSVTHFSLADSSTLLSSRTSIVFRSSRKVEIFASLFACVQLRLSTIIEDRPCLRHFHVFSLSRFRGRCFLHFRYCGPRAAIANDFRHPSAICYRIALASSVTMAGW